METGTALVIVKDGKEYQFIIDVNDNIYTQLLEYRGVILTPGTCMSYKKIQVELF